MPDDKIPIKDFAASIKAKYPSYKDVNDTVLVKSWVEKYPAYKDQVDLSGLSVNKEGALGGAGAAAIGAPMKQDVLTPETISKIKAYMGVEPKAAPTKEEIQVETTTKQNPFSGLEAGSGMDEVGKGVKEKSNTKIQDNWATRILDRDLRQSIATQNYKDKKLTEQDVDVLSKTPFGQSKNMGIISTDENLKKLYVQSHNGLQTEDVVKSFNNYYDSYNPKKSGNDDGSVQLNKQIDQERQQIIGGDISKLSDLRNKVINDLENKEKQLALRVVITTGGSFFSPASDQIKKIKDIDNSISKAESDFNLMAQIFIANKHRDSLGEFKDSPITAMEIGRELEESGFAGYDGLGAKKREDVLKSNNHIPKRISDLEKIKSSASPHQKLNIQIEIDKLKKYSLAYPLASENINYQREYLGREVLMNAAMADANELFTKGVTTNNIELVKKADNNTGLYFFNKDAQNGLINKYPDVGISYNARVLADKLDEMGENMFRNDASIQKAAKEIDKENPGYYETNKRFIDAIKPSMLPSSTFGQHFERGTEETFGRGIFGTGSSAEEMVATEFSPRFKTASEAGGEPDKIVWNNDDKAFEIRDNENYHRFDFNNAMRIIGKQMPGLIKWVLEAEGIGAIGEGLGLFKTATNAATDISNARKAIQTAKNIKKTTKLLVPMYIETYNQNRETADELISGNSGADEFKKDLLANGMTILSTAVFRMFDYSPNKAIQRMWVKNIFPDVIKAVDKNGMKILTDPDFFEKTIIPKTQKIISSLGKTATESIKGGGAMVADANTRALLLSIVNPDKAHIPTAKEDLDIFSSQALLLTVSGLFGLVVNGALSKEKLGKDVLYKTGLVAPKYIQNIDASIKSGDVSPQQGNKAISLLKTLQQEAYRANDETAEGGLPLTTKQKRDITVNNVRKRAALQLKEEGLIDDKQLSSIISESDKAISEIKKDVRLNPLKTEVSEDGTITMKPEQEPKVESAVIEVGGKTYEGKNHAEAIQKAKEAGEDISQVDRQRDGKFKLSDGTIIDRQEAKNKFGADHSEQLIPQDEAAKKADEDYQNQNKPLTEQPTQEVPTVKEGEGSGVGNSNPALTKEQSDAKGRVDDFVNGLAETNPDLHKLAATDPIAALNKLIDHHKQIMKGADANTKAYSQKAIDKFEALKKDHELANSKVEPTPEQHTENLLNEAENRGGAFAQLAKLIRDKLKGVKTNFVDKLVNEKGKQAFGKNSKLNGITLSKESPDRVKTFLHEAIHQLTSMKITFFDKDQLHHLSDTDLEALNNLNRIYHKVKGDKPFEKNGIDTNYNVFKNLHEFVAEAMANPEFQDILSKFKSGGKQPNVFKQFLDAVAKMLGLKDPTILDDIFHHKEKLIEGDKPKEQPQPQADNSVVENKEPAPSIKSNEVEGNSALNVKEGEAGGSGEKSETKVAEKTGIGKPPEPPAEEPVIEQTPEGVQISKVWLKEHYNFSKDFDERGGQQVANDVFATLKQRADSKGISVEQQKTDEVNQMKRRPDEAEPTDHNIITAGSHLKDIDDQLKKAIAENDLLNIERLNILRTEASEVLRLLGNKAGRNLGLFSLVFQDVTNSEIAVTRNNIRRILGVENVPESMAALDRSNLTAVDKDKVRPFVEKIEQLEKAIKESEENAKQQMSAINDEEVKEAIQEAYEKGKKEGEATAKTKPEREKKSKQLKDIASKLRQSDEMDKFLKGYGGDVQQIGFSIGSYKEIVANLLEGVAKVVEAGEKVGDYLKKAIENIKEGIDKDKLLGDVQMLMSRATLPPKEETIDKIRDIAANEGSRNITKAMVEQGLIKNIIYDHIHTDTPPEKIIDEATKELKQYLPDVTKEDVQDAFVKRNQFAEDKESELKNIVNKKAEEVKRITTKEVQLRALEAADEYHAADTKAEKEAKKSDYEKGLDEKIKKLMQEKTAANTESDRIKEINKEIDYVKQEGKVYKQAIGNKKSASEQLKAARAEKEKTYAEKGLRVERQERQPIRIEREYQDAIAAVDADEKLSDKEKTKKKEELKQQRELDLMGTHMGVLANLADSLDELKNENIQQANDAINQGDKETAAELNDLNKKITEIRSGINTSGENLEDMANKAYDAINKLLDENMPKGVRKELRDIQKELENNNQLTSDKLAEKRLAKQYDRDIKRAQSKINSGRYTSIPTTKYDFRRSEVLQKLAFERKSTTSKLNKLTVQAKEQNRTLLDRAMDVSTKILVSGVHTVEKVAAAAVLKPIVDSFVESTTGRLVAKYITGSPYTNFKSVTEGFKVLGRFKNEAAKKAYIRKIADEKEAAIGSLTRAYEIGDKKTIAKAENDFKKADFRYAISTLYQSIEANSMSTFWQYMAHNATDYDASIGKLVKKDIKDYRSWLAKTGYVLDGWIRIHGGLKTGLSARPEMMRSFVATIQDMQRKGMELSPENIATAQLIAANDYEYGRLSNPTGVSRLITKGKYSEKSLATRVVTKVVFPVSTIALNITKRGIDYSSLGAEGWTRLAVGAKEGMRLNKVEGKQYDTWVQKVKAGIDRMPLKEKRYINGVISRGMFGAATSLLALWGLSNGAIKYGGTWNDQKKRKIIGSDGEPLKAGEWEFFGGRTPHFLNILIDHTPEFLNIRITANIYQIAQTDKGQGKELSDMLTSIKDEIQSSLPFQTIGQLLGERPVEAIQDRFTRVPLLIELEKAFDPTKRQHTTLGQKLKGNFGLDFLNPKYNKNYKTILQIQHDMKEGTISESEGQGMIDDLIKANEENQQ